MSEAIVEAVALHHCPSESQASGFTALTAVHVADVLYQDVNGPIIASPPSELDLTYLERIKLVDRVPIWRRLAEEACREAA